MSYDPHEDARSVSAVLATAVVTFLFVIVARLLIELLRAVWACYQRYGTHPALSWSLVGWLAALAISFILAITQQPTLVSAAVWIAASATLLWLSTVAIASVILDQQERTGYSDTLDDVITPWHWR